MTLGDFKAMVNALSDEYDNANVEIMLAPNLTNADVLWADQSGKVLIANTDDYAAYMGL